ncbi:MAG: hypothetical protein ACRENL_11375 [Candidatus Dormibacteria bacterium]
MAFTRPITLQDVLAGINDDANQAGSVDLSIDSAFSQLATTQEACRVHDTTAPASAVVTVAVNGSWGDGSNWGANAWGA